MQKDNIKNLKLHVGKFWENLSVVKKCVSWAY